VSSRTAGRTEARALLGKPYAGTVVMTGFAVAAILRCASVTHAVILGSLQAWVGLASYGLLSVLCVLAAERSGRDRPAGTWLAMAMGAATLAASVLTNQLRIPGDIRAVVADGLALLFYPASLFACVRLPGGVPARAQWKAYAVDLALLAAASVGVGGYLWLRFTPAEWPHVNFTLYLVAAPFLVMVVGLTTALLLLARRGEHGSASVNLLLAGIIVAALADVVLPFGPTSLLEVYGVAWCVALVLIALAAFLQERGGPGTFVVEPAASARRTFSLLPYVGLAMLVGVLAWALVAVGGPTLFLGACTVIVGALVVFRQVAVLRENDRLTRARLAQDVRFRALVEASTDAVVVTDDQLRVQWHNGALNQIAGTTDPLVGRGLSTLVAPHQRTTFERFLEHSKDSAVQGRATRVILERTASSAPVVVDVVVSDHRAEPSIAGLVVTLRDVSERSTLETQLERAQRMDGLGRLAGGIAHDFNNSLTAILGFGELLESSLEGSADLDSVHQITRAARRASDLTRQLLAFARRQPGLPRHLDLGEAISDMQRILHRLLGESVALSIRTAPNTWPVQADPSQLEQVVLNLAINARDAMPDGGTLEITTANCGDGQDAGRPDEVPPGDYVRLSVADTGIGMDTATQARIFEPFFTTKPEGRGTGLGLATVYGIVQQAAGHITVESQPGQGTVFRLYFPRSTGSAERPVAEAPPSAGVRQHRGVALLVEDDDLVRALVRRTLVECGFRVVTAVDGAEAVELASQPAARFDLLVSDVGLPKINGWAVADSIRAAKPGIPVVFVSGHTGDLPADRLSLDPRPAFLAKPFTPATLMRVVDGLLEK
jgi:PAS domain S-box-containing protein